GTKAWPGRRAQCRPPFPPPPALPLTARAAPRRADRRPCPSAGSPASPRNATGKQSSPSPRQQPRPLPSSTHPPSESEDHDRFSSSCVCLTKSKSIALSSGYRAIAFHIARRLRRKASERSAFFILRRIGILEGSALSV